MNVFLFNFIVRCTHVNCINYLRDLRDLRDLRVLRDLRDLRDLVIRFNARTEELTPFLTALLPFLYDFFAILSTLESGTPGFSFIVFLTSSCQADMMIYIHSIFSRKSIPWHLPYVQGEFLVTPIPTRHYNVYFLLHDLPTAKAINILSRSMP